MWLLISRTPRPDVAYWRGRRWLALLDAVVWPTLWAGSIIEAPFATDLAGVVGLSILLVIGARRSHMAIFRNGRYRFTTWRWGLVLSGLMALGAAVKVMG